MTNLRLVTFKQDTKGKWFGLILENNRLITIYLDNNSIIKPTNGIEYLVEITKKTTCKNYHSKKTIYFAKILFPKCEVTIAHLLELKCNFGVFDEDLILFTLVDKATINSSYIGFRICEHKLEVKKLLPEVYQNFIAYSKEQAIYNTKCSMPLNSSDTQFLVYPITSHILQGGVNVFTSEKKLEENSLYVVNPIPYNSMVNPTKYSETFPLLRNCYIDAEVVFHILNNLLKNYTTYQYVEKFSLLTKKGNIITSNEMCYSLDIGNGFKALWICGEMIVRTFGSDCNIVGVHKNGLLVYSTSSFGNDESESCHINTARFYTPAELIGIYHRPEMTKDFIDELIQKDNSIF